MKLAEQNPYQPRKYRLRLSLRYDQAGYAAKCQLCPCHLIALNTLHTYSSTLSAIYHVQVYYDFKLWALNGIYNLLTVQVFAFVVFRASLPILYYRHEYFA